MPGRVAVTVVVSIGAAFALVALVLRPWWQDYAPELAQAPLGMISLGLGLSLALWLQRKPPSLVRPTRRRGRLRDRVPRDDAE